MTRDMGRRMDGRVDRRMTRHGSARHTFRGHEQSGPPPVRTWPVRMKWLARLDIAAAPPPGGGEDRDIPSDGVPLSAGPRAQALTRASPTPAQTRRSPQTHRPCRPVTCANATQAGQPSVRLPRGRWASGTNQAATPGPPSPDMAPHRAGRQAPTRGVLKQVRNTMSGRSGSVVYGVTVGKRERNPLMGNMKRSRRTLKWPAGFS